MDHVTSSFDLSWPINGLPYESIYYMSIWVDLPWREKDNGDNISALSQIAKKL